VAPKAADAKAADPKGADPPADDLKITGAVDHADRSYRVGEPIALTVEVNKAAYVAVLRVMPNGATTLVFPNSRQTTARVPAGAPLRIPEPGGPLKIAADKPGVVLFELIASERGGSWLFSRKPQEGAEFAELGATTRALAKDIVLSLKVGHGSDTAASHLALRVRGD
jgi:Lhr-like helicase